MIDAYFMAKAIQLARRGRYTTSPNPNVGCLIVNDDFILAEGWHKQAGQGHAEIEALNQIDNVQAQGATAYVTLEPCSHYGTTPPCCDALIRAGISRVVVAMIDPNPAVSGSGIAKLREAGIEVVCGVLEDEARALNRGFIKRMTENRPFVRSKIAMSLDGRTALASGESQWITSAESRIDVQRLRAESCAILTGVNTVLADNSSLTARVDENVKQPIRVVLDSHLRMHCTARMASLDGRSIILTFSNDANKRQRLEQAGFEVYILPCVYARLDLSEVMEFLVSLLQVNELLVEAGAILNGALLEQNLIDELIIYQAPCLLGDTGRGLFHLPTVQTIADKKILQLRDVRQIGCDLKLTLAA